MLWASQETPPTKPLLGPSPSSSNATALTRDFAELLDGPDS
ncbi:hypothetical protein [Streptomyces sp. RB17]|nr:hypothetical protein [Streptomyces sp. RB17]